MSASGDKPAWAHELPDLRQLQYAQALLTVAGLVLVGLWLIVAVVRDPTAVARIGRKTIGG